MSVKNITQVIFGVAFTAAGIIVAMEMDRTGFAAMGYPEWVDGAFRWGGAAMFWLMAMIFGWSGLLRDVRRSLNKRGIARQLRTRGQVTEATITRLESNRTVFVDGQPVFDSVDYTFTVAGKDYTDHIEELPVKVTRALSLTVGGVVPVRYLPEDPATHRWDIADQR